MTDQPLHGYYLSTGCSGWIPVHTDWEPNIGRWWYAVTDCAESGLEAQIDVAVDERAIAMPGESETSSDCGDLNDSSTNTYQSALFAATDGGNTRSEDTGTDQEGCR